jgi:bifunctional non-homologous end joining protein LigD
MLATLAAEIPEGDGWLFEVKWDGYRALAYVHGGTTRLVSRNGLDLTSRFGEIATAISTAVNAPDCVLDGEICALDAQGRSSFSALQQAKPGTTYVYYVFDLLELDGEPLLSHPLVQRRDRLERLLDRHNRMVVLSAAFEDGAALLRAARELGLEGVVAKRADSPYVPGKRTRFWLKVKTHLRQEFLIAGYTRGHGSRARLGALVLAVRDDAGELAYAGNCGTGFSEQTIHDLLERLRPLERATSPFPVPPRMSRVRRGEVVWVEPALVAEIEFAGWTHEGRLRAPSFQGLRDDKPPEDVRREEPKPLFPSELRRGRRIVRFSNLDKPFWPEEGITKGDLLDYYRAVAPVLVPHLRDRPFTMKRYPDGWQGEHFFQKDAPASMPRWIKRLPVVVRTRDRRTRTIHTPVVNDDLSLLWMINMGCIDCNTWYSRLDRLDRPDWVLFDLDPSTGVGIGETVEVALLLKQVLDGLGLLSFAKTSGAEGMHILVPIQRRHTYAETREFAASVASMLASAHPGLVTREWSKSKRRGVLIDANQNAQGKTIASVYSVRPKAGAPVSIPLGWEELDANLTPSSYSMEETLARIARHGDLFADVLTTKQPLGRALRALRRP